MIFDTHAHYDDEQFDEDRGTLLGGMHEQGVGTIVNVAAELSSIPDILALTEKYEHVYGAVGVHPDEVDALDDEGVKIIRDALTQDKIVAVGEIGLDYHREGYDKKLQQHWFDVQLDIAKEMHMPVIIHSRDAAEDTYRILKQKQLQGLCGVIHCFSYSAQMAMQYVDMGYYIGIGGVLTFKNAKKLKEAAKQVPPERIVLETDCPYLAPEPYRGKRNQSGYLSYVVDALAQIKTMTPEEVIRITEENARTLYRL